MKFRTLLTKKVIWNFGRREKSVQSTPKGKRKMLSQPEGNQGITSLQHTVSQCHANRDAEQHSLNNAIVLEEACGA